MTTSTLIEPSFADALAAIEAAQQLPVAQRRYWTCSLRQIAWALDRPPESIPARWTSVRFPIARLHHVPLNWTAKTLANHRASVKAALAWFGEEENVPSRGAPLTPRWKELRGQLEGRHLRSVLSSLMRYCSAQDLAPAAVTEEVLDEYMRYRAATTALATDNAARRSIARAWNACAGVIQGWPSQRLIEPPLRVHEGPAWEEFPEGLRLDIEAHLAGLKKIRRCKNGKRLRPCQPRTIRTRRAELVAVARMAVRIGIPIETLTSMVALLQPDVVEKVLDAYWAKDGDEPKTFTIDLGWKLLAIARETGAFDQDALDRLDDIRFNLEGYRHGGLTEKNLALIRQVLTKGVWKRVVNLPNSLMTQARALAYQSPVKAAVTAQLAVAIAILTVAPVRLTNLISIRLGENLIKLGGPDSTYMLVFPGYDVKNRVALEFPFDPTLTELINEYVHEFRPTLARGSNEPWLFPGESGGHKRPTTMSGQITERIEKETGLRITVHQFRHAAGAIFLKHQPGNYELVRRLLGHRNIQTTVNFYCGLETIQATEIFGSIIRKELVLELEGA